MKSSLGDHGLTHVNSPKLARPKDCHIQRPITGAYSTSIDVTRPQNRDALAT
jgi:hypothetical protein